MKNLLLCCLLVVLSISTTKAQNFFQNIVRTGNFNNRSFVIATSPNVANPALKIEGAITNRFSAGLKSKVVIQPLALEKPSVFGRFYPIGTAPEGTFLEGTIGLKRPIQIGDQILVEKGEKRLMSIDLGHQVFLGRNERIALEGFAGIEWNDVEAFKRIFTSDTPLHLGMKIGVAL